MGGGPPPTREPLSPSASNPLLGPRVREPWLIRFNRLIVIIRASLANLKKALKGLVVMDADLEALANALVTGQRPAMWMKRSYPSLKPLGGYVADMMRRLTFFADWIEAGRPPPFGPRPPSSRRPF